MPDYEKVVCPFCAKATYGFNSQAIVHSCSMMNGRTVVQRVVAGGPWAEFLNDMMWIKAENAEKPNSLKMIDDNIF